MEYCIVVNSRYIIGPFYSEKSAIDYCNTDSDLNTRMIQIMQKPAY